MAKKVYSNVNNHKCLLYWHKKGMGFIPESKDSTGRVNHMVVYPGYNTFDSENLPFIYKECKDTIANKILELCGITAKDDGTFVESIDLSEMPLVELRDILSKTYNPESLKDLGNPDVVGAKHTDAAANRMSEISGAIGTEADNIDAVDSFSSGLTDNI